MNTLEELHKGNTWARITHSGALHSIDTSSLTVVGANKISGWAKCGWNGLLSLDDANIQRCLSCCKIEGIEPGDGAP